MNAQHLTEDELDDLLCGEDLPRSRAEHIQGCLVCRRRRDEFLAVVDEAAGENPDEDARTRVRQAALVQWGGRTAYHRSWWLAAAAAVLVAVIVPLAYQEQAPRAAVDPDVVLQQVDEVLSRDPLAVVASEDIVETVVPSTVGTANGRSAS